MSCYGPLASWYDQLTGDVPYEQFANFYEAEFARAGGEFRLLLDLCCGTGTLTWLMAGRGYEMIAVDASVDMLMQAREKSLELKTPPLFLLQDAAELDLYGTVDAAVCMLDSINYLTSPKDVRRTLERLRLFIAPGGMLVFDINSEEKLRGLDGQVFLDETEDVYCVWRADYARRLVTYWMDIFSRQSDGAWQRSLEIHKERAYGVEELREMLKAAGFTRIRVYGDLRKTPPREGEQRIIFTAIRK